MPRNSAVSNWGVRMIAVLLAICARGQNIPVTWAESLHLNSLAGIDKALSQPRSDTGLPLVKGTQSKQAKTCSEYLSLTSEGYSPPTTLAQRGETGFVFACHALTALRRVKQPARSFLSPEWSCDAVRDLPPMPSLVVGSEEEVAAARQGKSRLQDGKCTVEGRDGLKLITERYTYTFKTAARGDFNGDGIEDLALMGCAYLQQGSGFVCRFMILTRRGPQSRYELIE